MNTGLFTTSEFQTDFWLFLGVVAGALIQFFLGKLQARDATKRALAMMKIEVKHNILEANKLLAHIGWLKSRISGNQIETEQISFPMQSFDYSAIGPLNQYGYLHLLFGGEILPQIFAVRADLSRRKRRISGRKT
jgi:hypothetical protein